ncbi:hypothetical protein FGG08_000882 [Glutinoglossum americanum]|uniref:Uncharacterized protein n=1 Tax=Glutinoglossum americanum TaxID=1670608 RepID=A0A9P8IEF2_9PEZI|nr:hypothetical protein FGG08_000882 [Glutinoglossum americanum]
MGWITEYYQVELILPAELYEIIRQDLEREISTVKYSRVILALSELLDGDFFNQYIKTGMVRNLEVKAMKTFAMCSCSRKAVWA